MDRNTGLLMSKLHLKLLIFHIATTRVSMSKLSLLGFKTAVKGHLFSWSIVDKLAVLNNLPVDVFTVLQTPVEGKSASFGT